MYNVTPYDSAHHKLLVQNHSRFSPMPDAITGWDPRGQNSKGRGGSETLGDDEMIFFCETPQKRWDICFSGRLGRSRMFTGTCSDALIILAGSRKGPSFLRRKPASPYLQSHQDSLGLDEACAICNQWRSTGGSSGCMLCIRPTHA